MTKKIFRLLLVLMMIFIFCFSSRNGDESAEDSYYVGKYIAVHFIPGYSSWPEEKKEQFAIAIDTPVRKTAHACEYALLALLAYGADLGAACVEKNKITPKSAGAKVKPAETAPKSAGAFPKSTGIAPEPAGTSRENLRTSSEQTGISPKSPGIRKYITTSPWRLAWFLAACYAATDEFHQLFVPGRAGQLRDVLLDSSGAAAGLLVMYLLNRIFKKK